MAETYLDSLSNGDIAALEQVLGNVSAVRLGKGSDSLKLATKTVDKIVDGAPGLPADLIIYQVYNGISAGLRDGEEVTEKAFLTGTGVKPKESGKDPVTVAIKLPTGTRALRLPDNGYVLARKQTLILKPTETGDIPAIIKGWKSLTAAGTRSPGASLHGSRSPQSAAMTLYPQRPVCAEGVHLEDHTVDEFGNTCHGRDGRFCGGSGGAGNSQSRGGGLAARAPGAGTGGFEGNPLAALTPSQKLARKNALKGLVRSVAATVVVTGLIVGAIAIDTERGHRQYAKERNLTPEQDKASRARMKDAVKNPRPGDHFYDKRDQRVYERNQRRAKGKAQSPSDWYDEMLQKPVIR